MNAIKRKHEMFYLLETSISQNVKQYAAKSVQYFSCRLFLLIGNMSKICQEKKKQAPASEAANSSNKPSQLSDPLQTAANPVNRCAGRQSVEQTYVSREK